MYKSAKTILIAVGILLLFSGPGSAEDAKVDIYSSSLDDLYQHFHILKVRLGWNWFWPVPTPAPCPTPCTTPTPTPTPCPTPCTTPTPTPTPCPTPCVTPTPCPTPCVTPTPTPIPIPIPTPTPTICPNPLPNCQNVNPTVTVDIKPGSCPNSINLNSKGNIPVAIFGSNNIDVADINLATIRLEGAPILKKNNGQWMASIEDLDGDGINDIVIHVDTQQFSPGDDSTCAVLTGNTYDGRRIEGYDSINIVRMR